jgi:hypothetical protein
MPTKIQVRRGTASEWVTSNPALSAGEFGFETDTGKFKIGDGTTLWNSLSYAAGADSPIILSDIVIDENYSIPAGKNALSIAPVEVDEGVTVDVPEGSVWEISPWAVEKTTDDLSEGSTNLYYTDQRVDDRIAAASIEDLSDVVVTLPEDGQVLVYDDGDWVNAVASGGGLGGEEYLFVTADGTAAENGAELAAAYAEAQTMTPYGNALSATNRVTILVAPGDYAMGGVWDVDADFVNILSLDGSRSIRLLDGIDVTADNAHLRGIDVGTLRFGGCAGPTQAGAAGLLVENCAGGERSFGSPASGNTPAHTLSGTFIDCAGGQKSFAFRGTASGTFTNCVAEGESFGSINGTASGTFTNCVASGTFTFGSQNSTASGTFTNCVGGADSFGASQSSTASGTFTNCVGGDGAFAGNITFDLPSSLGSTASGTFIRCQGGGNSWADGFDGGGALTGFVLWCRKTGGASFTSASWRAPTSGGKVRLSLDRTNTERNLG